MYVLVLPGPVLDADSTKMRKYSTCPQGTCVKWVIQRTWSDSWGLGCCCSSSPGWRGRPLQAEETAGKKITTGVFHSKFISVRPRHNSGIQYNQYMMGSYAIAQGSPGVNKGCWAGNRVIPGAEFFSMVIVTLKPQMCFFWMPQNCLIISDWILD